VKFYVTTTASASGDVVYTSGGANQLSASLTYSGLAVHPTNKAHVFAAGAGRTDDVFQTRDSGATWSTLKKPPAMWRAAIAAAPSTTSGDTILMLGGDNGIFMAFYTGATDSYSDWTEFDFGLTPAWMYVSSLCYASHPTDSAQDALIIGSAGHGVHVLENPRARLSSLAAFYVQSYSPEQDGFNVPIDSNVVLTFSQPVVGVVNGTITITELTTATVLTLKLPTPEVTTNGAVVTIDLPPLLPNAHKYDIAIGAGVFETVADGIAFPGIKKYQFTTEVIASGVVTCGSFNCGEFFTDKPGMANIPCATTTCQKTECCLANPGCGGFVCPAFHHDKAGRATILCAGLECVTDDCCDDNFFCSSLSCTAGTHDKMGKDVVSCCK
jgi:hypothetical protein